MQPPIALWQYQQQQQTALHYYVSHVVLLLQLSKPPLNCYATTNLTESLFYLAPQSLTLPFEPHISVALDWKLLQKLSDGSPTVIIQHLIKSICNDFSEIMSLSVCKHDFRTHGVTKKTNALKCMPMYCLHASCAGQCCKCRLCKCRCKNVHTVFYPLLLMTHNIVCNPRTRALLSPALFSFGHSHTYHGC